MSAVPLDDMSWMLRCLRGDLQTDDALHVVAIARATPNLDAELAEALADGDAAYPDDPRRFQTVEIGPPTVAEDPDTAEAWERRNATSEFVAWAANADGVCPRCGEEVPLSALGPNGGHAGECHGRADGDKPVRKVRLTALSTIKPRPVRWHWQDRVPLGEVTLTPGRGGIGKSTFHAWTISHTTRGTLPGAHHGIPRACIVAAAEDSYERTIVPRLIAAGADLSLVYRADVIAEGVTDAMSLSLPADIAGLEAEILRTGAALMSLDPLMSVIHGGIDTHKDREVRTALEPLTGLADRTGCAILGNAHFNKSASTDPMSLIMGSAAFGNVVRSALGFARDPEDEAGSCVISQVKNNLGRLDLPSLRYVIVEAIVETDEGNAYVGRLAMKGESERSVADILAAGPGTSDNDDAESVLREVLGDGPLWAKQVFDAMAEAGFSKDQAKRAKAKLKVSTTKVGKPGDAEQGWQWSLPEGRREHEGSEGRSVQEALPSHPSGDFEGADQ